MPTKPRREDVFIERFLSGHENCLWADADIDWPDKRIDGAVDALATRKSDGKTLAIEHTIIEPFVNEKEDFVLFEAEFLEIEEDQSLPIPGKWIQVFVPVGILRGQCEWASVLVSGVHEWLRSNRLSLPEGVSEHRCPIAGVPGTPVFETTLTIKVVALRSGRSKLHVRRQQIDNNLGDVVERALNKKLPKLVKTDACQHLLMLERQHMNLLPKSILDEIEKRKAMFPDMAKVDEIWIVETMFYESEQGLYFERYTNGIPVAMLGFWGTELLERYEIGMAETVIQEATI